MSDLPRIPDATASPREWARFWQRMTKVFTALAAESPEPIAARQVGDGHWVLTGGTPVLRERTRAALAHAGHAKARQRP